MSDLQALFSAQDNVARWKAERENATARLELARAAEARAHLLCQHEPVASAGIDREILRVMLNFTVHTDLNRMNRELKEIQETRNVNRNTAG